MTQQKTERLKQVYSEFQNNLTQFASKYKDQINHDSKFRDKFNNMCQDLGVDPMVCTHHQ
jgi:ESCRT-II complex subunit VPS22